MLKVCNEPSSSEQNRFLQQKKTKTLRVPNRACRRAVPGLVGRRPKTTRTHNTTENRVRFPSVFIYRCRRRARARAFHRHLRTPTGGWRRRAGSVYLPGGRPSESVFYAVVFGRPESPGDPESRENVRVPGRFRRTNFRIECPAIGYAEKTNCSVRRRVIRMY